MLNQLGDEMIPQDLEMKRIELPGDSTSVLMSSYAAIVGKNLNIPKFGEEANTPFEPVKEMRLEKTIIIMPILK